MVHQTLMRCLRPFNRAPITSFFVPSISSISMASISVSKSSGIVVPN